LSDSFHAFRFSPFLASKLLRQEILDLHAYHVPDSGGYIKLDAMENPYVVPQALRDEIAAAVAHAAINRYPDPNPASLKGKIRSLLGLSDGMEVLLGNGSDELIQLLAMAVNKPGATLLSVEPSFVMYKMIATSPGCVTLACRYRRTFRWICRRPWRRLSVISPRWCFWPTRIIHRQPVFRARCEKDHRGIAGVGGGG